MEGLFWPDEVAALLAGLVLVGGPVLRALLGWLGRAVSPYAPASQARAADHTAGAWLGFALVLIPFAFWLGRELGAGTRLGHLLGAIVGALALTAVAFDPLLGGWILLIPLPIYCVARLLGWGPEPT